VHEEQLAPILVHYGLAIRPVPDCQPINVEYLTHQVQPYIAEVDPLSSRKLVLSALL